jgi:hypothetical protein
VSGMEDGAQSHLNVTSRLALLKERNFCWDALRWGATKDLSLPCRTREIYGSCTEEYSCTLICQQILRVCVYINSLRSTEISMAIHGGCRCFATLKMSQLIPSKIFWYSSRSPFLCKLFPQSTYSLIVKLATAQPK